MSFDWLHLESKCDGFEPPERVTFITVAGTWSPRDWGFQADVARLLDDERWFWKPVEYPHSFGPINPPFPGAPSYADSVQQGVANTELAINSTPGRFAICGYSQGAEVVSRVCAELAAGSLNHRLEDCIGCVTFGDPARQVSDLTFGGGGGAGIARLVIPSGVPRITYAATGDLYCTTPVDTQAGDDMHAVYGALTSLGGGIAITDLVVQVSKILTNPIVGGLAAIEAMIRAMKVAAHGSYGPWVPHAADWLNQRAG